MLLLFLCEYVLLSVIWSRFGGNCQDFGYEGDEGPPNWPKTYAKCAGKLQSPINIETAKVTTKKFPPLIFKEFGNPLDVVLFENNGHTVTMKIIEDIKPRVQGGPLNGLYIFDQLHFHWGPNNSLGSENLIDNKSFPLELHVVMHNWLYDSFESALDVPDGLTVLSFLFEVGARDNEKFDKFTNAIREVRPMASYKTLYDFVSLNMLITPDRHRYYTYDGSLTTPPCAEHVKWITFVKTIPLADEQLDEFRYLLTKKGPLTHNFRPPQPINHRFIYYSGAPDKLRLNTLCMIAIFYLMVIRSFSSS